MGPGVAETAQNRATVKPSVEDCQWGGPPVDSQSSNCGLQRFAKEGRKTGTVQFMGRHSDHGVVGGEFRQRAGIDAVDFEKIQSSLNGCPLVAVEIRLTLGKMIRIGGGNFEKVATAVEVDVLGLGDGRFQSVFVADSVKATPRFQLVPMDGVDMRPVEE